MTIKTKACIYSPDVPVRPADFTLISYTPRYWDSLLYRLISLGRMQRISAAVAIHTVPNFVPPAVLIAAGWTKAVWIQILPKAFTHDLRCGNRTPDP